MVSLSKSFALILVTLFLTSLVILQATLSANSQPTWNTQIVDKNATTDREAIALDSNNNPHIAYSDYEYGDYSEPSDIMYASLSGQNWTIQTVTRGAGDVSLALDSNNYPHITYFENGLKYAGWNGSNWNFQKVDDEAAHESLKLDSQGNPHITYLGFNGTLKYANWTGTNWNIQTIDSSQHFINAYLALDANNKPHIFYFYIYSVSQSEYASLYVAKYAAWNGSSWGIQTILSADGGFGTFILDSYGYPHFTYTLGNPKFSGNVTIFYDSWTGSAWSTQTVAANILIGGGSGYLTLDARDQPSTEYTVWNSSSSMSSVMYAHWTGEKWDIQTVDGNADNGGPLAVGSDGHVHIIYTIENPQYPSYVSYVKYATALEPTITPTEKPNIFSATGALILPLTISIITVVVAVLALVLFVLFRRHRKTPKA
jgi:hypothetical protein